MIDGLSNEFRLFCLFALTLGLKIGPIALFFVVILIIWTKLLANSVIETSAAKELR